MKYKMLYGRAILALVVSLPASATTLFSIQASVTSTGSGPQSLDDRETVTKSYVLDVTGRTGAGLASLEFLLQGFITPTSGGCTFISTQVVCEQGSAGVTAPFHIEIPGELFTASYNCAVEIGSCDVPFTFNQPELITISAFAEAYLYSDGPCPSCQTVSASVDFEGVGSIRNGDGSIITDPTGIQVTLENPLGNDSPTPEPRTIVSVGSALLIGLALRALRTNLNRVC
jgi:hypothetical protein